MSGSGIQARKWIAPAAVLLIVGCGLVLFAPPENLLAETAQRVRPSRAKLQTRSYFWLDSNRLLLLDGPGQVRELNLAGGRFPSRVLEGVFDGNVYTEPSRIYDRPRGRSLDAWISPDRRRLLWRAGPAWNLARIAGLDGSRLRSWPVAAEPPLSAWLDDGRWVSLIVEDRGVTGVRIRREDSSRREDIPLASPITANSPLPLGVTPSGKLLIAGKGDSSLELFLADLSRSPASLEMRAIPLPAGGECAEVAYSAVSGRIAWISYRRTDEQSLGFVRAIKSLAGHGPVWRAEVWSCRLDGSERREAGHTAGVPYAPIYYPGWTPGEVPVALQWLPDGRRISFLWGDSLWLAEG